MEESGTSFQTALESAPKKRGDTMFVRDGTYSKKHNQPTNQPNRIQFDWVKKTGIRIRKDFLGTENVYTKKHDCIFGYYLFYYIYALFPFILEAMA